VEALAQREREATAALVAHLAVMLERRLYLGQGFSSLHTYCRRVLHMSEYAAYARVEAARAVRKYPIILERLAEGSLNLTRSDSLSPNLLAVTTASFSIPPDTKVGEIQELLARLRPKPPVPSVVRKLPTAVTQLIQSTTPSGDMAVQGVSFTLSAPERPAARPVVVPLAPDRYKVQFTASAEGYANLKMAQDLLRHQIPNGDEGWIIELALARLVKDLKKERLGAADRPRVSRGTAPDSRHIPADVKRKVWARDGGQCAFVAQDGCRCDERGFLEFHHVQPYGAGGKATLDNIELRCRTHNQYEADAHSVSVRSEPEFRTGRKLGL
jgi:hypothetical protein